MQINCRNRRGQFQSDFFVFPSSSSLSLLLPRPGVSQLQWDNVSCLFSSLLQQSRGGRWCAAPWLWIRLSASTIKALSGLCCSYKRHAYLKATSPQDFSNMLLESDLYGVLRATADRDALGRQLMILWVSAWCRYSAVSNVGRIVFSGYWGLGICFLSGCDHIQSGGTTTSI